MKKTALWLLFVGLIGQLNASENLWYPYKSGVGADGYDLISYFDGNGPQKGSATYSAEYDGVTWHFRNAKNRDQFLEDPARYTPQYGGYCAYAAAKRSKAYGDPTAWTLHKGKLYFNYNRLARRIWEGDIDTFIPRGDKYWSGLLDR